jgi:phospholipase/carboxylesterase
MPTVAHKTSTLRYLAVLPEGHAEGTPLPAVICLHGYGANMHNLAVLTPLLDPAGRVFLFPDAPLPAFDGADLSARAWIEADGDESPQAVEEALDAFVGEALGRYPAPPGKVVLLGFSQGGALALRYGIPRPETFAGVVSLSGSLGRLADLDHLLPARRDQSVFVAHGRRDNLVPCEWSRRLAQYLDRHGYPTTFKTYAMGHQITPRLLADLRGWLKGVLPPGQEGMQ